MGGVAMDDTKKLERVREYVYAEIELCDEQIKRAIETKDKERERRWKFRYDVLYGVWLRLND